ncbi:unnamed protein product [Coffea canephora]|uniref:Uncharacterized protein n=1 Tax=Coffea canephora TaxID=49390 RepID=A0A068VGQ1_COFCA|nr:unnamed protein product [Coffea canephora]
MWRTSLAAGLSKTLSRIAFPHSYPYWSFILLELADLQLRLLPAAFFLWAGLVSFGRFPQPSNGLCFELASGKVRLVSWSILPALRCRFDVDLTDHTDTLTASVFGDLAETLLTFTALEAMNYHEENAELPLEKVHQELQSKMFIIQLKAAATRDGGGHQRYTIVYCFEDVSSEESANKSANPDVQTCFEEVGNTVPASVAPENQVSSSKVRIRLDTKFAQSEDAHDNTSKDEEASISKKAKKN